MKGLWTPGWIARHLAAVVLILGFLALGWWQLSRATAGNTLSWGYTVEWPIFAGFVAFIWWRELRLELRGRRPETAEPSEPPETEQESAVTVRRPVRVTSGSRSPSHDDDPALSAYNDYLSWLGAHPGARPGDYPG